MWANLNEKSDVTNEGHVAQKTPKAGYSSNGPTIQHPGGWEPTASLG